MADTVNQIDNVLMVVIDCLRADHLRCYGYPIQTAASIDAWADVGNQFMFASGCPRTMYALGMLLTGRNQHSITEKQTYITEEDGLLWQVLADIDCFCFSPNEIVNGIMLRAKGWDVPGHEGGEWFAPGLTNEAIKRISDKNGWFGLLWYADVHAYRCFFPVSKKFDVVAATHLPPENTEWGGHIRSYLYDLVITYVDMELRRLWQALDLSNTAIIITADHGEMLYPRFNHIGSPTPEITRIPLIIILPGQKPMNRIWNLSVSWVDFAPTIASLFGKEIPDEWDGQDLLPMMTESKNTPEILERLKSLGYVS